MTFIPREITKDNDLTLEVGPIQGRDPADNTVKNWTGTQLQAWIVQDPASDTALGSVTLTVNVVGGAVFVPSFNATDVNTILAAALAAGVVDGDALYCILKGADEFRVAVPLVYRSVRRAA